MTNTLKSLVLKSKLRWGTESMREQAASTLANTGDRDAINSLARALRDRSLRVRLASIKGLGQFGGECAHFLAAILSQNPNTNEYETRRMKSAAIQELRAVGGAKAADAFSVGLRASDDEIREMSADALCGMADTLAISRLKDALDDRNAKVRRLAILTLGKRSDSAAGDVAPDCVARLARAIKDPDATVRLAAVEALARMHGADADNGLAQALRIRDKSLRMAAADALGSRGGDHAVHSLARSLKDPEVEVRIRCISALEAIGTDLAVMALAKAIADHSQDVRTATIKALGSLGKRACALDVLANSLQQMSERCDRALAAEILGEHGDSRALEDLVRLLPKSKQYHQIRIVSILNNLGWKPTNSDEKLVVKTVQERVTATKRAKKSVDSCNWEDATALGAPALLPLVSAAKRLNGGGSAVKEVVAALEQILENASGDATCDELQAVSSLPNQLTWSVKVMSFAADFRVAAAMGGWQSEREQRFHVDCSRVKSLASSEIKRRSSKM